MPKKNNLYMCSIDPNYIKGIKAPTEADAIVSAYFSRDAIKNINTPSMACKIVSILANPDSIENIDSPCKTLQALAVALSPDVFLKIKSPAYTTKLIYAGLRPLNSPSNNKKVDFVGCLFNFRSLINIKPTIETMTAAILNNKKAILLISRPSKKIKVIFKLLYGENG